MEADQRIIQFYSGGVIETNLCGINLDHAVLVVGVGTYANGQYFLIKNSWGTDWGEDGYMRIQVREGNGICGINMYPYQPYVNKAL